MKKIDASHVPPRSERKHGRARRLPRKDAALVRMLIKRLRWWAKMLDKATHA